MAIKSRAIKIEKRYPPQTYNTKVGGVARKYGVDLGVPDDTKLGDYLKQKGYYALSEMLRT
jgi:hypothetical protein